MYGTVKSLIILSLDLFISQQKPFVKIACNFAPCKYFDSPILITAKRAYMCNGYHRLLETPNTFYIMRLGFDFISIYLHATLCEQSNDPKIFAKTGMALSD